MKIFVASVALIVCAMGRAEAAKAAKTMKAGRITTKLSKAALEATKKSSKLRTAEQGRIRKLVSTVSSKASFATAESRKAGAKRKSKASPFARHLSSSSSSNQYYQQYQNEYGDDAVVDATYDATDDPSDYASSSWYSDYGDYDVGSNEDLGFDITDYSFHYSGCSTVKAYSDEMAADETTTTVLQAKRMAMFRLCPSTTCKDNSHDGCSSNYGEYVVSMDQFLQAMVGLQEDRVLGYCMYCSDCANIESIIAFFTEMDYHRQYVVKTFETNYETWLENYLAYTGQAAEGDNAAAYSYGDDANANGDDGNGGNDATQNSEYAFKYYQKLMGGNYANKWKYGNGNGNYKYQYQYSNSYNNYQNQGNNNANGGNYNYNYNNAYNNNANNNNAYGGNYNYNYNYNANNNNNNGNGNYNYNYNVNGNNANAYNNYNNGNYNYNDNANGEYGNGGDQYAQNANGKYVYQNQQWMMWNSFNNNEFYNNGQNGGNYGQNQNGGNYQNANGQSSSNGYGYMNSMSAWGSLGAWYGNKIVNGYMTWDGAQYSFVQEWGFIGTDGQFHSLEDEEELQQEWDPYVYGFALPEDWSTILEETAVADLEPCPYESSSSCYNQFFACMQVLGLDEQYEDMIEQWNEEVYTNLYEDAETAREGATLADYLECAQVEFDYDTWSSIVQSKSNAQNNANNYYNYNNNNNNADNNNADANYDDDTESYDTYMSTYGSYITGDDDGGDISFYVGPHCDGEKITLAVYSDAYCSVYVPSVAVEDIIGYNPVDANEFELVPTECISCNFEEMQSENQKWYDTEEIEGVDDGINPFCSILYQVSGKCNKYMNPTTIYGDTSAIYQSENQQVNEDKVCSYIESLKYNTYDESGDIIFNADLQWWKNSPSDWQKEIRIEARAMNNGLKAGLVVSSLAFFSMVVAALVLHGILARKNIPFSRRGKNGENPMALERQNSGILFCRSRSGPTPSPLV